ncbi:MAG: PBP1A family penicillin-binding protein [Bdellovibrio sp.]|nr:PBP1A family penicillin-binding protein [Bdellovibrio sp.]
MIDAFLAAEDDAFYQHHGVDYWGVLRAMLMNIKAGKVVQGGSTITQQVAKSLLLTKERSVSRKVKDFLLALKIEEKFSKDEILFLYLNQVYLGGGYYGIKTAVKGYYDKDLEEVTTAEAAMVAGLLVAPGKYSPYLNPDFAIKRQRYVLSRLYDTKKITQDEYENAIQEKIKFRVKKKGEFKAGYFTDWVRQRVIEFIGEEKLLNDGLKIVTSLDYELQTAAEKAALKGVREIDKRQGYQGPIQHLETLSEREKFDIDQRKFLLEEKSNYFYIDDHYNRINEIPFVQSVYDELKDSSIRFATAYPDAKFPMGRVESDDLIKILEPDILYKALVTRVDDELKLVFVSLGGIPGIIVQDGFQWARKREVSEEHEFYITVSKPSTILKQGDVVWVSVSDKESTIQKFLTQTGLKKFESTKWMPTIKKQKYLSVVLEQIPEAQGALISLSPESGEIFTFVGGNNFLESQFNRAVQSFRQPGSSIKPLIYAAALENGYRPNSIILDSPEALSGGEENELNWKPKNYDGKYLGPITFRHSLEQSRNITTIKLAEDVGVRKIMNIFSRFGLEIVTEENLSIALGSFGVNLLDLVSAYAVFPNGGRLVEPVSILSITDKNGTGFQIDEKKKEKRLLEKGIIRPVNGSIDPTPVNSDSSASFDFRQELKGRQVYDPRLAYVMTGLLKGVIQNGTGRPAKYISNNIAGKTGTTSNYIDAWFLGYSTKLTTGVWVGFDNNKTMGHGETGTRSALPVWIEFMNQGLKKFRDSEFPQPPGIVNMYVHKSTGRQVNSNNPEAILESFVEGMEPGSTTYSESKQGEKGGPLFEEEELLETQ